jgi:hypothetical protein
VVGALLIANAWAVIDAKMAVSAAAREATRAFVEAPSADDAFDLADAAARSAITATGRNADRLVLASPNATFARCETVQFVASYPIPTIRLPWVGGLGNGFTVTARHAEVVDPYRTGVAPAINRCVTSP